MTIILEVCANSYMSGKEAELGGAFRIELCENMAEGGTTPSYGQIRLCKERLNLEVWPIIRPRGGDFLYNDDEFEIMKADITLCKNLNCDGVVTGILLANGEIDQLRCAELIKLASPMPIAFHRAFDMCNNMEIALEKLIELGFVRVLTSGGAENAFLGMEKITRLVKQAASRIEIMPGAGINPANIKTIQNHTGAKVFHSSARIKVQSKMYYKGSKSTLGSVTEEYEYEQTSSKLVSQLIQAIT